MFYILCLKNSFMNVHVNNVTILAGNQVRKKNLQKFSPLSVILLLFPKFEFVWNTSPRLLRVSVVDLQSSHA